MRIVTEFAGNEIVAFDPAPGEGIQRWRWGQLGPLLGCDGEREVDMLLIDPVMERDEPPGDA
jgi:hypothetical protein